MAELVLVFILTGSNISPPGASGCSISTSPNDWRYDSKGIESEININPKIIHISTDQLYASNFWSEIGDENPINIYSKSKLQGDMNLLTYKKSLILRTNFLWSENEDSSINWLRQKSKNNEKFTGCSVHFVNEKLDGGKIILQKKIKIFKKDNVNSLKNRVLKEEYKLYPKSIIKILSNY